MFLHGRFDAGPELLLPLHVLGAVLLHQIRAFERALEVRLEAKVPVEALVRQSERLQGRAGLFQHVPDECLDIGLRVVHDDVQAVREEQSRP